MIEYEKINLNLQSTTKKDCSCNKKIDIKNDCATSQCFKVDNYFSELVHNWEKEAARYNLGIQELEGIEYITTKKENTGEILTKVVFKYRKGHELITKEFYCSPKGDTGERGRDGDTGPQGPKGDKGDTPTLNKVILTWTDNCNEEGGRFVEDCINNGYNLELKLKRPDVFEELSKILDLINEQLTQFYAKKSDLLDYVKNATFTNAITDILNRLSTAGAEYRLIYNAPWLYLTKDGKNVSSVKIEGGTSSGNSYYFTGSVFVYQIFPINYSEVPNINKIVGSDWENKGWLKSIPDREDESNEAVWMATCNVESGSYGTWSYTKLTGANGIDGVDSDNLEFIYYRTSLSYVPSDKYPHVTNYTDDKPTPSISDWLDHPQGVTEELPYEFYSFSKKENGIWTDFVPPMIWSHYGRNGHDGDGVEYIFRTMNSNSELIMNPTPTNIIQHPEYLKSEYVPSQWSDNPNKNLQPGQYQYVCQRVYKKITQTHVNNYSRYGLQSSDIGSYMWLPFSDPAVWNYYAKDGTSGQTLTGSITRLRGIWKAGETYYRNSRPKDSDLQYLDIILAPDESQYYILNSNYNGTSYTASLSWDDNEKLYWTEATGFGFVATRALMADNATINYLDSNEVRIWNGQSRDRSSLVAGMTSGTPPQPGDPVNNQYGVSNPVRIWAGSTVNSNNTTDLTLAPFRVYNDGSLVANNATLTGTFNQNLLWINLDVNLQNLNLKVGFMGWLIITDNTKHEVNVDVSYNIIYDDSLLGHISFDENGLYFIVVIANNRIKIYKFDQATAISESVSKYAYYLSGLPTDKLLNGETIIYNGGNITNVLDSWMHYTYTTEPLRRSDFPDPSIVTNISIKPGFTLLYSYRIRPNIVTSGNYQIANAKKGDPDTISSNTIDNYFKDFPIDRINVSLCEKFINQNESEEFTIDVDFTDVFSLYDPYVKINNTTYLKFSKFIESALAEDTAILLVWDDLNNSINLITIQIVSSPIITVNFTINNLLLWLFGQNNKISYFEETKYSYTETITKDYTNATLWNGGLWVDGRLVATYQDFTIENQTSDIATFKVENNNLIKYITLKGNASAIATANTHLDAKAAYLEAEALAAQQANP